MKITLNTLTGDDFAADNERLLKDGKITAEQAEYFSDIECQCDQVLCGHLPKPQCKNGATFRVGRNYYICADCLHTHVG